MKIPKRKVHIAAQSAFLTKGLEIVPSIAGSEHAFSFKGHNIRAIIPHRPKRQLSTEPEPEIWCLSGKKYKSGFRPTSYAVERVWLTSETSRKRSIREDAFGHVNHRLFSGREKDSLTKLAQDQDCLLLEAFRYWASVVRWKCDRPSILHSRFDFGFSNSPTYLVDSANRERFFAAPLTISASVGRPISKSSWNCVAESLATNVEVPLWQLSYSEAHQKFLANDSRGAVLELAISIEVLVRKLIQLHLSSSATEKFKAMVGMLSLKALIENWAKLGFLGKGWHEFSAIKKDIVRVVDERNSIIHKGIVAQVSEADFWRFSKATAAFLAAGEAALVI